VVVSTLNKITSAIGEMEVQKARAISDHTEFAAKLQEQQKELEEKYGNVTIDLTTGEYTENVEEAETVE
jgi:hypothetical protein